MQCPSSAIALISLFLFSGRQRRDPPRGETYVTLLEANGEAGLGFSSHFDGWLER